MLIGLLSGRSTLSDVTLPSGDDFSVGVIQWNKDDYIDPAALASTNAVVDDWCYKYDAASGKGKWADCDVPAVDEYVLLEDGVFHVELEDASGDVFLE